MPVTCEREGVNEWMNKEECARGKEKGNGEREMGGIEGGK